jgi:hypothetical protein
MEVHRSQAPVMANQVVIYPHQQLGNKEATLAVIKDLHKVAVIPSRQKNHELN